MENTVNNITNTNISDIKSNITNITSICSNYLLNHFDNSSISNSIDLILKKCFITDLKSVWVSKIISFVGFAFLVIIIKLISDKIKKRRKDNIRENEDP